MNCLVIDDDEAVGLYMQKLIDDTGFLTLLQYFSRPEAAAAYIMANTDNIDIVFVDVEMPGMSGIDLISMLSNAAQNIKFVIISSKDKYAIDALYNNAAAYILKPLNSVNFLKAVSKVKKMIEAKPNIASDECFFVKDVEGRYVKIAYDSIYWIEVNRNNITINTNDNSYLLQATLKDISTQLPDNIFFKTHRSFIVNIRHVDIICNDQIIMRKNGKDIQIPLSRNYKNEFLDKMHVFKTVQ